MLKKVLYIIVAIAVIAFVVAMAIIYHDNNPLEHSLFPQCAFFRITGWQCPGCGSQRALHYLLNGDIHESFRMNPLLWVGVPYVAVVLLLRSPWLETRCVRLLNILTGLHACILWLVAIVGFWILRNVF